MENTINTSIILDKKMEKAQYGAQAMDNYYADGEITVTITLNEYRRLVSDNATTDSRIAEANKDKYTRDAENKALKEENAKLKAELYELKKATDDKQDEKK